MVNKVVYAPCPQYSRHNFDKYKHSFVISGTNHLDTSAY